MFKLLAIRPLDGCLLSVSKCLQKDKMYYFCNDYTITEDYISLRDEYVRILPKDFFNLHEKSSLEINVSAVVGMNGDGKSSLIELLMRLINNFAKRYKLLDKDNLSRIEGVKAELYYLLDNSIYCIRERQEDSNTNLLKCVEITETNINKLKRTDKVLSNKNIISKLFYTIVSNYSHYAYNTKEFNENTIDVKYNQCWLHYLFHKNDGYRTPITIHPYRFEGNIDINRENELTKQRLMSLYIQESSLIDNENSFRKMGNKIAEFLQLTDIGYSKLQEITIKKYFQESKKISLLSNYISKINSYTIEYGDNQGLDINNHFYEYFIVDLYWLINDNDSDSDNNKSYKTFLLEFIESNKGNKGIYSSKSDLKQVINSLDKLKKETKDKLLIDNSYRRFKKYSRLNLKQIMRLRFIYEVAKYLKIPSEIITKDYSSLNEIEKCYHYIIYKIINICSTYPEYRDFIYINKRRYWIVDYEVDYSIVNSLIDRIMQDKSHITLKLRQCINFIEQYKINDFNVFDFLSSKQTSKDIKSDINTCFLVKFDSLKQYYNKHPFPLDLLPPPIYKSDIVYILEQNNSTYISYKNLSSGEKQLLNNIGALLYHLRNIDSITTSSRIYNTINIILEEIELYFHPEYQRRIVKTLIEKLSTICFQNIKRLNITFVTHSPFILSDIPICNVLFLDKGRPIMKKIRENTFGSNIHGILRNSFFLPSLPIGEFAHDKINNLFDRLNSYKLVPNDKSQQEWFYSNIMRVGEPYLRDELMKLYYMHYPIQYND